MLTATILALVGGAMFLLIAAIVLAPVIRSGQLSDDERRNGVCDD